MRFLIAVSLSLFVGLALGSPIGQVEVTTLRPDLLRSDLDLAASDATTIVVEIFADDATAVVSATERARQAPAAGTEEESNEDNEEEEATTASSGGSSGGRPSSSGGRTRPEPAIPQPFANSSDFLAEYQFSSQFNLGPKDEAVPLAVVGQAPLVEQSPQVSEPQAAAAQPVAQVAQVVPPVFPPAGAASPDAANPVAVIPEAANPDSPPPAPLSAGAAPQAPAVPASVPSITAAGEDEDDAESEEDAPTEAPAARLQQQQQQQVAAQRIEESDSDNEITSDDVTTVKSFASEYEYTVQQLGGGPKRRGETKEANFPTEKLTFSSPSTSLLVPVPITTLKTEQISSNQAYSYGINDTDFLPGRRNGGLDIESPGGGELSDGEGRAACECGRLPFRVPLGSEAEFNTRPWTVAIVRGGLIAGGRPHCAGVLINDRYVLSSASCLVNLHPNGLQVWLTAYNTLSNHHLNTGTSKLNVQEVILHPNYQRGTRDNDIALIKMTQPIDIITSSSYFAPVCLPSGSHVDFSGRYGMVFGWGNGRVNRVCTGEVPILQNSVCKRDTRHGSEITDNMMCAGFLTPTAPIRTEDCLGDAGGPLTVQINGRVSLVGITSWGYELHHRGHNPTVYTKVAGYADWILHNTEDADWCVG